MTSGTLPSGPAGLDPCGPPEAPPAGSLVDGHGRVAPWPAGLSGAWLGTLATSAAITPVEGESAEALEDQGGVAALLRY